MKKELYLRISEHTLIQEHSQCFGVLGRKRNHVLEGIWLALDFPTVISNAKRHKECLQFLIESTTKGIIACQSDSYFQWLQRDIMKRKRKWRK